MNYQIPLTILNSDLTSSQKLIMITIYNNNKYLLTINEIAEILNMQYPNVRKLLRELEEKGLIETSGNSRNKKIRLTHMKNHITEQNEFETKLFDAFIFSEFRGDECYTIETSTLYKKLHFLKESVIDKSLQRLVDQEMIYANTRIEHINCPEQGVIENTVIYGFRLTEKGRNFKI